MNSQADAFSCVAFARTFNRLAARFMKTIDLGSHAFSLDEVLSLAHTQSGVVLMKQGQPVAQVLPMREKTRQRAAPLHPGAWSVREDFDEPSTEEFLLGQA